MSGLKFFEQKDLAKNDVVRSWRRVFHVTGTEPMLTQGAKHKRFTPHKITVEVTQHNDLQPYITKVAVSGPFIASEGTGQRTYNRLDVKLGDLPEWLLVHAGSVVAEAPGRVERISVVAQKAIVTAIKTAAEDAAHESYMETKANMGAGELWSPATYEWARSSWQGVVRELIEAGILGADAL